GKRTPVLYGPWRAALGESNPPENNSGRSGDLRAVPDGLSGQQARGAVRVQRRTQRSGGPDSFRPFQGAAIQPGYDRQPLLPGLRFGRRLGYHRRQPERRRGRDLRWLISAQAARAPDRIRDGKS